MLVDAPLERALAMALVIAPELAHELPETFDGGSFGDFRARATWEALCRLVERGEQVDLLSVRAELEAWAEHRELTWYERPSPAWPWSLVDTADLLAERLARDPGSLPVRQWAWTLERLAANRRAAIELDEDIVVEPESEERHAA